MKIKNCKVIMDKIDNLIDGRLPSEIVESIQDVIEKTIPSLDMGQIIVNVRWFDAYLETFEASEVRIGGTLLWMRLQSGQNRHIPLREVRWFSTTPKSHEKIFYENDHQHFAK